jgi:hypothetical protein
VDADEVRGVGKLAEADLRAVVADPDPDRSDDPADAGILAGAPQAVGKGGSPPRPD